MIKELVIRTSCNYHVLTKHGKKFQILNDFGISSKELKVIKNLSYQERHILLNNNPVILAQNF